MDDIFQGKIENTKEFADMFRKLREDSIKNGKMVTAQQLSLAVYPKNRAWASQVESGRLKKVKYEDMITVYKYLFDLNEESALKRFENDYKALIRKQQEFKQLTTKLFDTLQKQYNSLETHDEQQRLYNVLSCLNSGFEKNYSDTIDILYKLDFALLKESISDEHRQIMEDFSSLKEQINAFQYRDKLNRVCHSLDQLIEKQQKNLNNLNGESLIDTFDFVSHSLRYMTLMMQLIDNGTTSSNIASIINTLHAFVATMNNFSALSSVQEHSLKINATPCEVKEYISKIRIELEEIENLLDDDEIFMSLF